jgi:hypothetical protein
MKMCHQNDPLFISKQTVSKIQRAFWPCTRKKVTKTPPAARDGAQVEPLQDGLDRQVPLEVEEEAHSPPAAQAAQEAAALQVALACQLEAALACSSAAPTRSAAQHEF